MPPVVCLDGLYEIATELVALLLSLAERKERLLLAKHEHTNDFIINNLNAS